MTKFKFFLTCFLFPFLLNFAWGNEGHQLIAKHALNLISSEIGLSQDAINYIIEHSVDPDYRKKDDPDEPQRHFIDIDFYSEFLNGSMINSKETLKAIYGDSTVKKMGLLPWATSETFDKLVNAFKEKDRAKILLYSSDLAHYVGDGHQPLHATINYNGQLTGQKGIHFRYEIEMFNRYLNEIEANLKNGQVVELKAPLLDVIFDYIYESNFEVDIILNADKKATQYSNNDENKYYELLWFRTRHLTIDKINQASIMLASMIYTAWLKAEKPVLSSL
ncbi:hypothetical protein [Melioribacter sp. OK-6-Me]|uniref:hypothetical protein n=1 Tax=unclassified Melioribacter TaxID=2627329 RepID=UPI003EDAFDA9